MGISRREFVKFAALAGAGAAGANSVSIPDAPPKALDLLILGGTGFIGPCQVRYAVSRGHKVSVFNRGRRQADLPDSVEHLVGDRNDNLESLKGRKWDVVIDNPTTLPRWVRDSGQLLADATSLYVFISTISVYADTSKPGMDEDTPLLPYQGKDAMAEKEITNSLYGPLKALSEKEVQKWFPGRSAIVRPGLIVGPGDPSDRFTYWPVRIDRGGEVLAPGVPADPVQFIDARDLSEWTIRVAEMRVTGTFNATGPRAQLGMAEMLYGIRAITSGNNDIRFTWADADFLDEQKVSPWMDMPVWVPPRGEEAGFSRVSVSRALAEGLTFRPLAETARDTLAWFKNLPDARRAKMQAGLTAERERAVLAAWHTKHRG